MDKWKKRGSIALTGAMCLLMLAGCSGETDTTPPPSPEASGEITLGDGPIKVSRPEKKPLPWQSEITYEYLGMRFSIDPGFQEGIEDGTLYFQREALYDTEGADRSECYYAYQYLQYLPEGTEDMEYAVDWDAWLATTQRIGTVGAYRADYLEEHPIETITGCPENTEVGRSEDGKWVYYLSTDAGQQLELGELWRKTKVELIDRATYEANPDIPGFYDVFDTARNNDAASFIGDFHAQDLDGNPVDLSVFADYQLTMVNVMTTWCSSCVAEMPDLAKLSGEVEKDGVQIITIVADTMFDGAVDEEKLELSKQIRSSSGVEYPMLVPDEVLLNGRLKGINAYPETFFVDSEGNIVGSIYCGAKSFDEWNGIIAQELAALNNASTGGGTVSMGGGTVAMS